MKKGDLSYQRETDNLWVTWVSDESDMAKMQILVKTMPNVGAICGLQCIDKGIVGGRPH